MKQFILISIFAIGMLVMWPPGHKSLASTTDQVSFVANNQIVVTAVIPQYNYNLDLSESMTYNLTNNKEGGGVEVRVFNLVTQPTYLINKKTKSPDFTAYYNIRCSMQYGELSKIKQRLEPKIFVHRFARDGLIQI